jgi:hypothetical protein
MNTTTGSDFDFGFDEPTRTLSDMTTNEIEESIQYMRTHNYMATLDGMIEDAEVELAKRTAATPCGKCGGSGVVEGPPPAWGYNEYFTISCSCQHHESCDCRECSIPTPPPSSRI